jgi:membrane fusion protein (multidrug efflux system)
MLKLKILQKRVFFLSMACLVLWASACKDKPKTAEGAPGGGKPATTPSVYDAIVAQTTPVNRSVEAPGTILASEATDIQPEIAGRVISINFTEGATVAAGTLLVKLFDADLQAQLRKLQVQLNIAEATEKRQKELLAINGTSQQDVDNAILNVSNIKADIELLKVQISRTEIKAPFYGRVGLRNISLGAYVTPATIITNIAQVNALKVEFAVPEKYAPEMLPGKMVSLTLAAGGKVYNAKVLAAQNLINAETRNLMVRALVQNADKAISPGAFVQVGISVGNNASAIMVPTESVIPTTRNKRIIVVRQGTAVFQNVSTGYRDSARVEVYGGIASGDTIVVSGLLTIKEGMPVKVKVTNP